MIQIGTILKVIDNSGARYAVCIKILGGHKHRYALIGDKIIVSINALRGKRRSQSKVQKGKIAQGVVIQTSFCLLNKTGITQAYLENSVVLINQQGKPLGTRIFGGIPKQIRYTKYMRLATVASGLIK